jgi:hypothetical protein
MNGERPSSISECRIMRLPVDETLRDTHNAKPLSTWKVPSGLFSVQPAGWGMGSGIGCSPHFTPCLRRVKEVCAL